MLKNRLFILPLITGFLQVTMAAEPKKNINTLNHKPPLLQIMIDESKIKCFDHIDDLALHVIGQFHPEFQSSSGIREMDGRGMIIQKNHNLTWKQTLEHLTPLIESDLSVFLLDPIEQKQKEYVAGCFKDYIKLIEKNNKHKRLSLFMPLNFSDVQDLIDPLSFIFANIQALVLKTAATETIAQRLSAYVQGERPLCQGVVEELTGLIKTYGNETLYPSERQLRNIINPEKVNSFKKQMIEWLPLETELCAAFNQQMDQYVSFIQDLLLPKARVETTLPTCIYKLMLKINGVEGFEAHIPRLIAQGRADFDEYYAKFMSIGNQIAAEKNDPIRYPQDNPGLVLQNLMKDSSLATEEETIQLYSQVQDDIEEIILQENFITLPQRPLRMRPGTVAEEASFPVPHVNTPNFINNTGKTDQSWPEFVLCDLKGNSSYVGAYALCAHEGRPGHDLQFSRMVKETITGKMNLFMTALASNSTNAEGWAHYVEYRMSPHFTLECQMGALQDQLMRMARMFLDPGVNLGLFGHDYIVKFHQEMLGLGEVAAKSEADRYTFLMPGQAVSYRFGALQIMAFRKYMKTALYPMFNQRQFHDLILSHGLMPLKLVKDDIMKNMFISFD